MYFMYQTPRVRDMYPDREGERKEGRQEGKSSTSMDDGNPVSEVRVGEANGTQSGGGGGRGLV